MDGLAHPVVQQVAIGQAGEGVEVDELVDAAFIFHPGGDVHHRRDDMGAVVARNGRQPDFYPEVVPQLVAAKQLAALAHFALRGVVHVVLQQVGVVRAVLSWDEVLKRFADQDAAGVAEHGVGLCVGQRNDSLCVDHDHAGGRCLHRKGQVFTGLSQLQVGALDGLHDHRTVNDQVADDLVHMSQHVVRARHGGVEREVKLAHGHHPGGGKQQRCVERLRRAHFVPQQQRGDQIDDNAQVLQIFLERREPLAGDEQVRQRILVKHHHPIENSRTSDQGNEQCVFVRRANPPVPRAQRDQQQCRSRQQAGNYPKVEVLIGAIVRAKVGHAAVGCGV